jgi:cold shock CspA family protein
MVAGAPVREVDPWRTGDPWSSFAVRETSTVKSGGPEEFELSEQVGDEDEEAAPESRRSRRKMKEAMKLDLERLHGKIDQILEMLTAGHLPALRTTGFGDKMLRPAKKIFQERPWEHLSLQEAVQSREPTSGTVVRWRPEGFGFVRVGGKDVFAHASSIRGSVEGLVNARVVMFAEVDVAKTQGDDVKYRATKLYRENDYLEVVAKARADDAAIAAVKAAEESKTRAVESLKAQESAALAQARAQWTRPPGLLAARGVEIGVQVDEKLQTLDAARASPGGGGASAGGIFCSRPRAAGVEAGPLRGPFGGSDFGPKALSPKDGRPAATTGAFFGGNLFSEAPSRSLFGGGAPAAGEGGQKRSGMKKGSLFGQRLETEAERARAEERAEHLFDLCGELWPSLLAGFGSAPDRTFEQQKATCPKGWKLDAWLEEKFGISVEKAQELKEERDRKFDDKRAATERGRMERAEREQVAAERKQKEQIELARSFSELFKSFAAQRVVEKEQEDEVPELSVLEIAVGVPVQDGDDEELNQEAEERRLDACSDASEDAPAAAVEEVTAAAGGEAGEAAEATVGAVAGAAGGGRRKAEKERFEKDLREFIQKYHLDDKVEAKIRQADKHIADEVVKMELSSRVRNTSAYVQRVLKDLEGRWQQEEEEQAEYYQQDYGDLDERTYDQEYGGVDEQTYQQQDYGQDEQAYEGKEGEQPEGCESDEENYQAAKEEGEQHWEEDYETAQGHDQTLEESHEATDDKDEQYAEEAHEGGGREQLEEEDEEVCGGRCWEDGGSRGGWSEEGADEGWPDESWGEGWSYDY